MFRLFKWCAFLFAVFIARNFEHVIEQRGWHDMLESFINAPSFPNPVLDQFWVGVWTATAGFFILEVIPMMFRRSTKEETIALSFQKSPNAEVLRVKHSGKEGISFVVPKKVYDGPRDALHRRMIGFRFRKNMISPVAIVDLKAPGETAYCFRKFSSRSFGVELGGDLRGAEIRILIMPFDALTDDQQRERTTPEIGRWVDGKIKPSLNTSQIVVQEFPLPPLQIVKSSEGPILQEPKDIE